MAYFYTILLFLSTVFCDLLELKCRWVNVLKNWFKSLEFCCKLFKIGARIAYSAMIAKPNTNDN